MYTITPKATTNNKFIVDKSTEKIKWNDKIPQWIQEKAYKKEMGQVWKSNRKIDYLNPITSLITLNVIGLYTSVKRLSDWTKKKKRVNLNYFLPKRNAY